MFVFMTLKNLMTLVVSGELTEIPEEFDCFLFNNF